jgi:hypothetical protein
MLFVCDWRCEQGKNAQDTGGTHTCQAAANHDRISGWQWSSPTNLRCSVLCRASSRMTHLIALTEK